MKINNSLTLLAGLLILTSLQIKAQKKELNLKAAFTGKNDPENLSNDSWRSETDLFTYAVEDTLMQVDATTGNKSKLLSLDALNKAMVNINQDSLEQLPSLNWFNKNHCYFNSGSHYFLYNLKDNTIEDLFNYVKKAENKNFCAKNMSLAYTLGNDLYIAGKNGEFRIANSKDKDIVYGKVVHRREFGISKGTFWSPEGQKLAFYRKDESMVTDYPLVDIDKRIAEVENIKYPMAGQTSHHVKIGVYDLKSGETIYLKTGKPKEKYLTNVTWGPAGEKIYVAVLNRKQNHMKLNAYNAKSGELLKTLFEETHEKYVEPEHGPVFIPGDNEKFLWFSERDGFDHLYFYNTSGKLIRQVTKGDFEVLSIDGFSENQKKVFITTTKESPLERHLYAQHLKQSRLEKITEKKGTHNVNVSKSGKYFLDSYKSIDTGSEYILQDINNEAITTLVEPNSPLKENYKLGETDIFTVKSANNQTDLYCRTIKPHDFDSTRKYPVIIYVYGGPHAQMVRNTWLGGGSIFLNYLANQGYIVFTMDNRGSAHRGLKFENTIHRHVGEAEVADQMKGVQYLKNQSYVDSSRIGVYGWSYGGFMTISLLLEHPDAFKAGVAGGPVINWKYYEVMYGERYMDIPRENPEGYKKNNLTNKVGNLDTRLLIIHGTMDPTVVWQNSLKFLDAAIKKGKLVDYFVYPGQEHNVGGIDRLHLYKKIDQYFKDFL